MRGSPSGRAGKREGCPLRPARLRKLPRPRLPLLEVRRQSTTARNHSQWHLLLRGPIPQQPWVQRHRCRSELALPSTLLHGAGETQGVQRKQSVQSQGGYPVGFLDGLGRGK